MIKKTNHVGMSVEFFGESVLLGCDLFNESNE